MTELELDDRFRYASHVISDVLNELSFSSAFIGAETNRGLFSEASGPSQRNCYRVTALPTADRPLRAPLVKVVLLLLGLDRLHWLCDRPLAKTVRAENC
jgi:hypothetical protein